MRPAIDPIGFVGQCLIERCLGQEVLGVQVKERCEKENRRCKCCRFHS